MSLRTLPPHQPGGQLVVTERRGALRHPCLREIACHAVMAGGDANVPALLEDLSVGGLRLELRRGYEPGRVLAVSWRHPSDGAKLTLLAQVVHARDEGSGNWVVGCALVNPLSEADLAALL